VQESNKVTLVGGIMVGYSNQVFQSTDGNNWVELAPFAQFSARDAAPAVNFLGDLWLIGGYTNDRLVTNEIWRSNDGLAWTRVTPVGAIFSPRDGAQAAVFNGRLWVIGGWDDYVSAGGTETRTNDVWSTADGVNWTQHAPSGPIFSPRVGHRAIVFNNKLWIVGGYTSTNIVVNDVWSTLDGVNWILENGNAAFPARGSHELAVLNGAIWMFAGGDASSTGLADIWTSTNGVVWTPVTPVGITFAARLGHAVTVANGRMWLVGGESTQDYNSGTRFNDVWSTTNGVNWTLHTAAAQFDPRAWHSLVSRNNELWVIGGFNLDLNNEVWRSTDGANWRVGFNGSINTP
jgi:hypothetical protein